MKKLLFPILLIAALVLPACGGQATQAPGAPVELTFMMWGAPEELAVWNQIVQDFQAQQPNITVKVEVSDWEAYWEKLKTMLAASTPPDLFAMDAPLYLDYQSRGVLKNLQPYLDQNPDLLKDVYPQTLEAYKLADGYYGLPRDFQTIVLFYNKDMFDAAQVAYPTADWTYDDLRSAAKQLTLDTNSDGKIEQYGFYSDLWDMELIWSEAIWAYGGDILSADHTKTLIAEPPARQAWQVFYDMMFTDKSMPDTTTAAQFGGDPFQAGAAAMTSIGHWAVPGYNAVNFKWDVAPMPKGPAGPATSVNSAGFVVAQGSKHPDEAFEFIKFVLSSAGQTRLTELGFAIPVLKSVAESDTFLKQPGPGIDQQVFLDSLAFARMKPVFKGYDEWSATVGDGMAVIWTGEKDLNTTLDEVVPAADEVLAKNK
ncbi:MAG: sugar ABC transporter substrate-binding protein [Chloroflexi bacterium]|nr:sugar ABC transporter substrate-binding protein [Chloroflexota bacterium]